MLCGILAEPPSIVVDVERLASFDMLFGIEQYPNSAPIFKLHGQHVLLVLAPISIVYAAEELRYVAEPVRADVQTRPGVWCSQQTEDTVVGAPE